MEETQRKRRNDSTTENNEAYEKKQRVEQLIGALSRPAKKLYSSSSVDSIDTKLCIEVWWVCFTILTSFIDGEQLQLHLFFFIRTIFKNNPEPEIAKLQVK